MSKSCMNPGLDWGCFSLFHIAVEVALRQLEQNYKSVDYVNCFAFAVRK